MKAGSDFCVCVYVKKAGVPVYSLTHIYIYLYIYRGLDGGNENRILDPGWEYKA